MLTADEVIKATGLSVRAANSVLWECHGVKTMDELREALAERTDAELRRLPNCGAKTISQIKAAFNIIDLSAARDKLASELEAQTGVDGWRACRLADRVGAKSAEELKGNYILDTRFGRA